MHTLPLVLIVKVSAGALDLENFDAFFGHSAFSLNMIFGTIRNQNAQTHIYKLYIILKFRKQGSY